MAFKKMTSFFALTISTTMATVAVAAINIPASENTQVSFSECSLSCQEFSQISECQKYRRDNQLCVEKKKSVGPHYSAAVLEELEC